MPKSAKELLITIEGIDGVGKSTHAKMLTAYLKDRGFSVISLSEPTGGYWGRKIRNLTKHGRTASPKEECQWFLKDRMEDVEKNIKPALDGSQIVIMDRYYYSTMAYQGALGLDVEKIRSANEKFAPKPDLVIILDVSPETGLKRITEGRKEKLNYFETLEYQRRVRDIFLDMKSFDNVIIIDASGTQEEVQDKIRRVVEELIGPAIKD